MASKTSTIGYNALEARRYYDPDRKVWVILPPGEVMAWTGYGRAHNDSRRR